MPSDVSMLLTLGWLSELKPKTASTIASGDPQDEATRKALDVHG